MNQSDEVNREAAADAIGVPPSARVLLRVVYSMGIVLVLLFLILVGAIIWKAARKPADVKPPAPATLDLGLAPGTEFRSAQLDGDRLLLNTGREVIVIDLRKNQLMTRVSANP